MTLDRTKYVVLTHKFSSDLNVGLTLIFYNQGRIEWTRGPGQSCDREAPKMLGATA